MKSYLGIGVRMLTLSACATVGREVAQEAK